MRILKDETDRDGIRWLRVWFAEGVCEVPLNIIPMTVYKRDGHEWRIYPSGKPVPYPNLFRTALQREKSEPPPLPPWKRRKPKPAPEGGPYR